MSLRISGNFWRGRAEVAACEQVGIEADHFMAGGEQNGAGDRTDIAFVTC